MATDYPGDDVNSNDNPVVTRRSGVERAPDPPLLNRVRDLEHRLKELEEAIVQIGNRDSNDLHYLAAVIGGELPSDLPQPASPRVGRY
jgi:hypothetical protein